MQRTNIRFFGAVLAVAALLAGAQDASAQLDMAGTWNMTVESEQNGTTNPTLVLVQEGTNLTGQYSSATLGDSEVTGTIDGQTVRVTFMTDPGAGMELPLTYNGTVDANGVWTGSLEIDFQGQVMPLGTFSATKG